MSYYFLPVILCGCCVMLLLFSAGCADLPSGDESFYFGPQETTSTAETTEPTETMYVTPATPYATATTEPFLTASATPEKTETVTTYCVIFQDDFELMYNTVAYDYELAHAPLTIDFKVSPTLVERFTEYYSNYGSKEYISIKRKVPADNAAFKLTAYDKDTGEVIAEEGYGHAFTYTEEQSLVLRSPGNYHIEMYGSLVTVNVTMTVPCDNIPPPTANATA